LPQPALVAHLAIDASEARMSRHFAELAFTAAVKQEQERHGSRYQHEQVEHDGKGLL